MKRTRSKKSRVTVPLKGHKIENFLAPNLNVKVFQHLLVFLLANWKPIANSGFKNLCAFEDQFPVVNDGALWTFNIFIVLCFDFYSDIFAS
jgi:hypothetical protein